MNIEKIKAAALAATQDKDLIFVIEPSAVLQLIERLEAAERDAAKWHEHQAKKKVLADRGFGKSPLRDAAMKEKP